MVQASQTVDALFEQALLLDPEHRAALTHLLIDSLAVEPEEKEPGYDEYWEAELERQDRAIEEGREELVEYDEAMAQIFGSPRR